MYEVELKVPADLDVVRERLHTQGGTLRRTVRQRDTYYDHPQRSFAETDEALRVRSEEWLDDTNARSENEICATKTLRTLVTYKGPLLESNAKTRSEFETEVHDSGAFDSILQSLGFEPVADVEKRREIYDVAEFTVSLDAVEGVGTFVEIEGTGPKSHVDELEANARTLLIDLGLDPTDHQSRSYLERVLRATED